MECHEFVVVQLRGYPRPCLGGKKRKKRDDGLEMQSASPTPTSSRSLSFFLPRQTVENSTAQRALRSYVTHIPRAMVTTGCFLDGDGNDEEVERGIRHRNVKLMAHLFFFPPRFDRANCGGFLALRLTAWQDPREVLEKSRERNELDVLTSQCRGSSGSASQTN